MLHSRCLPSRKYHIIFNLDSMFTSRISSNVPVHMCRGFNASGGTVLLLRNSGERRKRHRNRNTKMKRHIKSVQSRGTKKRNRILYHIEKRRHHLRMKPQRNPSRRPNDTTVLRAIIKKVASQGLMRHINRNTMDNRVENLQWVTFCKCFSTRRGPLTPSVF
jgi:hypothetical protein